jgi:hypothetical protein
LSVVRFPVGPPEAPASIPTQRGRATWFTAPSASSPAGSRTDLSNCTPLRQGEVGEARDWPRLPESVGAPGIDRRLCPCLHRRPPPSYRSSPSAGVDQAELDSQPSPPPAYAALSFAGRSAEQNRLAPRRFLSSAPDHGSPFRQPASSVRSQHLATAFRSPAATVRFRTTATGSQFPACCFPAEPGPLEARSTLGSSASPGLATPGSRAHRQGPVAPSEPDSPNRSPTATSLRGFSPLGINAPADLLPGGPPSEKARLPFAPRSPSIK